MRKRLLMGMLLPAACMASALAYDATTIIPDRSILDMLPGEIANDGKTYVFSYTKEGNEDSSPAHFYIYDEDFQLAKEFVTLPRPTEGYSYQVQTRANIPVRATISDEYVHNSFISIDGVSESLTIQMVLNKLGDGWEIVTLEDGTQVVAVSTDFYQEEYLGKKYPQKYYKQVDGLWYLCSAYYQTNYAPYGEWEEPETYEHFYRSNITYIEIIPTDGSDEKGVDLTRGIFSEDFNYVYPEFRKMEYSKEYTYDDTDFVYRKEWGYKYEICAFNVYDSSNKKVATLEFPEGYQSHAYYLEFYRLGNKKYIALEIYKEGSTEYGRDYFTAIYLIDGNNSVKLLTIAPSSKVSPRTPRQGETVTVTFDDSSISSVKTVQVVSSTGQMMQQTKIPAGQESFAIDTSRFQQGMYIVNILTEGRTHEAAKIIVR